MENVATIERHQVYADFVETLKDLQYHVWHGTVDCSAYGLPQHRRRLVLLASRLGEIELIRPTHEERPPTVRSAIGALPPLRAGEVSANDPLHQAAKLSELNLERIRASKPGEVRGEIGRTNCRAACHRRKTGRTYPSVYGRMEWDKPAPTLDDAVLWFWQWPVRSSGTGSGDLAQGGSRSPRIPGIIFLPSRERTGSFQDARPHDRQCRTGDAGKAIGRSIRQHLDAHPDTLSAVVSEDSLVASGCRGLSLPLLRRVAVWRGFGRKAPAPNWNCGEPCTRWASGTASTCRSFRSPVESRTSSSLGRASQYSSTAASGTAVRNTPPGRNGTPHFGARRSRPTERETWTPTNACSEHGWAVVRVWTHEAAERAAERIADFVEMRKEKQERMSATGAGEPPDGRQHSA